jgi:glycosyltransferase involved in cell wall biosynthesis
LTRAGHDNVLVCARGGAVAHATSASLVVELPMRGELDAALLPRLVRALRRSNPDLVHVHSRRGADLYGGLAAAIAGLPAVLTRRVDAAEPEWLARWKYRPYAAVIALSRAIEAQLLASGVAPARLARIPSAVDTSRWRPDASARARLLAGFDLPHDALLVGVVAQLIERKGHAALLAALPELVRRWPALRVLCFGRGPLASSLRAEITARGLGRHVLLCGFRDDLPTLVPGLDLLVHAATREGLGLALLEAGSAGVPAVASAAGGVPDVVIDGSTGILFPAADHAALRAAVGRLLAAPAERARLGAAARAHAERHFNIASLVDAHLSLYQRVLGARAVRLTPPVSP